MTTVKIPFEKAELSLPLPESWKVVDTVEPLPHHKVEDVTPALRAALEAPVGTSPLRDKDLASKSVVICLEDISRPTPTGRFFGTLLDYLLEHGAVPNRMLILFGLGVHRDMTEEEAREKIGNVDLRGIRWINHAFSNEQELTHLGTTSRGTYVSLNRHLVEADLIITVGAIEPHLLLGFGGGAKMILPGLASARTIAENHMQGVSAEKYNYVGMPESPMRLDLEEGVRMLRAEVFILNAVMNRSMEICAFFAGDAVKAHREGVRFVQSASARPVAGEVDVVIVASNPMNADLRQGMKCIGNVQASVRPGGLIISVMECRHGIGDLPVPPRTLPNWLLRLILKVIGAKRVLWFVDHVRKGANIEERFLSHFSAQLVRRNKILVYSRKLPADTGEKLGIFVQYTDVESMMKAARRHAPKEARVLVYPYGGATYPVLHGKA
ncbi:MAG TPA: nickel-dependent lactate racemase [Candidatus Saccharimonadia bacterium]|nr:nickel-dependent lactate racemase [Candidatus Saccharimonadia bacterium]